MQFKEEDLLILMFPSGAHPFIMVGLPGGVYFCVRIMFRQQLSFFFSGTVEIHVGD